MMRIGNHRIPTRGEELVARPTFWERLTRKLFPDPWAAEEREALLQHARRIKMKTDLLEERMQRRREKEKSKQAVRIIVGTLQWGLHQSDLGNYWAILVLEESIDRNKRWVRCNALRLEDGKHNNDNRYVKMTFDYIGEQPFFLTTIKPWYDFQHTTEQLKDNLKDTKLKPKWA